MLPGVPGIDQFAFDQRGGLGQPVAVEQLAVQDDVGPAVVGDPAQCGVQILRLGVEDRDALVAVAVGVAREIPNPAPSSVTSSALRNQTSTSSAW